MWQLFLVDSKRSPFCAELVATPQMLQNNWIEKVGYQKVAAVGKDVVIMEDEHFVAVEECLSWVE